MEKLDPLNEKQQSDVSISESMLGGYCDICRFRTRGSMLDTGRNFNGVNYCPEHYSLGIQNQTALKQAEEISSVGKIISKINEIVEWINTQEKPRESSDFTKTPWVVENKPQDQYKQ